MSLKLIRSVFNTVWYEASNRGQRVRRLLASFAWQIYKRTVRLPIITRLDNGMAFVLDPASGNSAGAIYTRIYESQSVLFVRHNVKPGGAILDVGAHAGLYTLLLAPLFSTGYCFEPAEDSFKLLKRNIALNYLNDFELHNTAVSSRCGEMEFITDNIPYSASAHLAIPGMSGSGRKVSVITIDSVVAEGRCSGSVTFIKIDTEGHELDVLKGSIHTLQKNPKALVQFENSAELPDIVDFFAALSWKCFGLNKDNVSHTGIELLRNDYNLFAIGPEHPLIETIGHDA